MGVEKNIIMRQLNESGTNYDILYPKILGDSIATPVPITAGGTGGTTAPIGINNIFNALPTITPAAEDGILFKDVSGNTSGKTTLQTLANLLGSTGGYVKIQAGSYTGTGKVGQENPNSLSFDFIPKLVFVQKQTIRSDSSHVNVAQTFFLNGVENTTSEIYYSTIGGGTSYPGLIRLTWNDKTVSWYAYPASSDNPQPDDQLNESNAIYYYIGFGLG